MSPARLPQWARPAEIFDLTKLAVPVVISRASFMLMQLTDSVLLGWYAPGQVPFVLNAWLPIGVFFGFGMGLMIGVQVLSAELNGSGKGGETGRIFRRGLAVAMGYGVLAMLACIVVAEPLLRLFDLPENIVRPTTDATHILAYGSVAHMGGMACQFYLEALRRPNVATAINMTAVLVNLGFGLWLVPDHGAIGVVWATTGSRWFMLACFIVAVVALTPAFKRAPKGPKEEFRRQNMVGVGTGLANVAEWGSFNMTFVIATKVSLDAGTIYGLAVQIMGVVFMVYMGMASAGSVRVAEYFGRRDAKGVQDASRLSVAAALSIGLILMALVVVFRGQIAMGLVNGGDVSSAGAHLVPALALMLAFAALVTVFDGMQVLGAMALRAQGVVWIPTAIHVGSYVVVMLPLAWWLALETDLGVWGVFIGAAVASVLAGLGQVITLEVKAARGVKYGLAKGAAASVGH